jgi:hypothetical protein
MPRKRMTCEAKEIKELQIENVGGGGGKAEKGLLMSEAIDISQ